MKVIIPLAGKGTRLRPHTLTVPKPMLRVAGKPVMDYVLDDVRKLGDVDEVIYITGHLKEAVELHAKSAYPDMKASFIEQQVQDGTAGAVGLARSRVDQPVLIIFVDTIFDADLSVIKTSTDDGILWTKVVEDWHRFGVIVADENGPHDEDRREADDADFQVREHRTSVHQELEAAVRRASIT